MQPELTRGLIYAGFFVFGLVATMLAENVLLPLLTTKKALPLESIRANDTKGPSAIRTSEPDLAIMYEMDAPEKSPTRRKRTK